MSDEIPEGCVKCPQCNGSGKVRVYYGPWEFASCFLCMGKGYLEKELLEHLKKAGLVKEW